MSHYLYTNNINGKPEPTRCKGCGNTVHETVSSSGWCRKCIKAKGGAK